MGTRLLNLVLGSRLAGVLLVGAILLPGSPGARADQPNFEGVTLLKWRPTSPGTIWDDASQTLTWHFNPLNFPQATWPSIAQAGAAFENGYRTIQDVVGTSLKIVRGPDRSAAPALTDGNLDMCFALNGLDPFTGANISNYFAVCYVRSNGSGAMTDADVVMNGHSQAFNWATTYPPPNGTNDVEVTACHEQIHSIGGGHPVYFYSMVWPTGRAPEMMLFDRCLAPDDRNLIRRLYPGTPASRTILGRVVGGDRAIVVATDGNGIPQAARVTDALGDYDIVVPAGAGYTLTAHHHSYTEYDPSDIDFDLPTPATAFISASTTAAVDVTAGNATAPDITLTLGAPSMKITGVRKGTAGQFGTQVAFLNKSFTGTFQLEVTTATPFNAVSNASLGPGINVNSATAAINAPGSIVTFNYTVTPTATAGLRNLTFTVGNERLFVPAYVEVVDDSSTLTVSTSAGNPPAGTVALGLADVPLLGFTLTANAVEDVRIRSLRFNLSGSGSAMPNVKLWFDNGTLGVKDGPDVRIFTGNAYATPGVIAETIPAGPSGTVTFDNLAVTIPAGQAVNFLFTGDMPASGNSTYTINLNGSGANIEATGMFYGNSITATGTAAGNPQDVGSLALTNLDQLKTTGLTPIPAGGSTNETQVTIRGTVTSSAPGTVGMEVEVKPVGQAFTNVVSEFLDGQTNGSTFDVTVTGLTNQTSYHWQARPTHATSGPGAWVSFGLPNESLIDFSSDNSTVAPPTGLAQFEKDGMTPVALGGLVKGRIVFSATNGAATPAGNVRLEIEARPSGTPFTGTPNAFSSFGPAGPATASFAGPSNTYHWQARTANAFGTASTWVAFDAAAVHFDFKRASGGGGGGGCIGTVAVDGSGGAAWMGVLAALTLLAVLRFRK